MIPAPLALPLESFPLKAKSLPKSAGNLFLKILIKKKKLKRNFKFLLVIYSPTSIPILAAILASNTVTITARMVTTIA